MALWPMVTRDQACVCVCVCLCVCVCVCFLHELVVLYNVIHTCRFIHAPGVFGSLPPNLLFPTHGRDACATASATQVFLAWIAQGLDFKATSRTAQCRELCFGFGVSIGHWLRMWPIPPHWIRQQHTPYFARDLGWFTGSRLFHLWSSLQAAMVMQRTPEHVKHLVVLRWWMRPAFLGCDVNKKTLRTRGCWGMGRICRCWWPQTWSKPWWV